MAVRGGCSVVPSGLGWFMWVLSQHFVLGYVRSSLRDSGLDSRWGCVGGGCSVVPSGLWRFPWAAPALRAGLCSVVPSGLDWFMLVFAPALRAGLCSVVPSGLDSAALILLG